MSGIELFNLSKIFSSKSCKSLAWAHGAAIRACQLPRSSRPATSRLPLSSRFVQGNGLALPLNSELSKRFLPLA